MAKKEPAHRVPIGRIEAAIWRNEDGSGRAWFNVTLSRSYTDGDQWKETNSLGFNDLLGGAKALDMAFDWIWAQQQAARSGKGDS